MFWKKESECIIFSPWKLRENGNSYFGVQVLFKCQWQQEKIVFTVVQGDQMTQNTSNAESEVRCIHGYINTYMQLLLNKKQQLKYVFALANLIIQHSLIRYYHENDLFLQYIQLDCRM
jgi:hypothetical protein